MPAAEAPPDAGGGHARAFEGGLRVEGVVAGYDGEPVLRGVSLSVEPGEVVGLIGPNGAGKTTLVRVCSRALAPSAGDVSVGGVDPYSVTAREAARLLAVVPQELAPAFAFTAEEVVLMGRSPYLRPWGGGRAEDWAAARRAMRAADVERLASRPVQELSGGDRQRVVLAQALAQEAPVLLLDEPTTHLDVRHVLDMLALIRGLARTRGTAVLGILHDLSLAAALCDRMVALSDGRVVAEGPPEDVVTPDLLWDVYGVEAEVTRTASGRPAVAVVPGLHGAPATAGAPSVHVVGGGGRGAPVMRMLAERGLQVTAGVLHATDSDATVAGRLGAPRVTVPPFSEIDPESAARCRALAAAADAVVVCDAPFGAANVENLRVALAAARDGVALVVLEASPIGDRDFTGGEATALWAELTARALLVAADAAAVVAAAAVAARRGRP